MSAITTRSGKGSALTSAEVDANFTNLNSDKAEKSITISAGTGLTGGGDLSGNRTLGLATSGVSAGTFGGNNSIPTLTIDAFGRVTAAGTVTPSGTWGISVSGNAATVTNGVYTNGSYADPAWITSINYSKLTGTVPTWNQNTTGNAATATALQTARLINGVSFNGSANITVADATKLPLAGGTMTGAITFSAGQTWPTFNQSTTGSAATLTTGRTIGMTGDVTWTSASFNGSANVTGTATLANSGVTAGTYPKVTVDAKGRVTAGASLAASDIPDLTLEKIPDAWVKRTVRAATTANITLSAPQTIDGIAVVAGDRVLVKDQTTASQNGIYVVAAGAWTRAADADTISELAGACVNVDSGTTNGGLRFDTDLKSTDTLGTTAVSFYRIFDSNDAATANTASKLVLRDASGNFSAGTVTAALSGNATTATTLQTARAINGVSFNGSADITIADATKLPLAGGTMTGAITFAAGQTWPTFNQSTTGSAATLTTGRTIAMTGDVTWTSASFNGSANVTGTATLANSGVTAASYGGNNSIPSITVDAKGRVTAASTVTPSGTWGISISGTAATATNQSGGTVSATNAAYTGTLTGGTGIINIGSGQVYKDASGNVGIGTTSPGSKLVVGGGTGSTATPTALALDGTYASSDAFDKLKIYLLKNASESYGIGLGGLADMQYWAGRVDNGMHRFFTAQIERARIDSVGNLLLGTTTATSKLTIGSTGAAQSIITGTNAGNGYIQFVGAAGARLGYMGFGDTSSQMYLFNDKNAALIFGTNNTERARITNGGDFSVNGSATYSRITINQNSQAAYSEGLAFHMPGQSVWQIVNGASSRLYFGQGGDRAYVDPSTGSWNAISDRRAKKNIEPLSYGLNEILALEPVQYHMLVDDETSSKRLGFIAQDVKAVINEAVDATDDPDRMLGLDKSVIVPVLVKSVQELHALIEAQAARIATLEAA